MVTLFIKLKDEQTDIIERQLNEFTKIKNLNSDSRNNFIHCIPLLFTDPNLCPLLHFIHNRL